MYRDQPLRLAAPKSISFSPQRLHPFDYRKEYTPHLEYQRDWFTKSVPPLDLRVKSTLSFPMDFEGFLLECESGIRAVMARSGEAGNSEQVTPGDRSGQTEASIGRVPRLAEDGNSGFPDPLRRPEFHGPLHLASACGELQTAPEDLAPMFISLVRAVSRNIPVEVQGDSLVALDSPGLRNVPFLLLSFAHEPRLSAGEKNHLRRYLRGGGFVLVYGEFPPGPDAVLSRLLPDSRPEEVQVKRIPSGHPIFHSLFDLPEEAYQAGQSTANNAPLGIWMKERLVAVCLARKNGYWVERASEDPDLKLWVNLVAFALAQPGGITEEDGAAGPR